MSQIKPTIVFVPGAWHTTECYSGVANLLEAAGYTTKMVELKSVGGKPVSGFEPDVEVLHSAIESACDANQDVVLFMHSYSGICGSEAVKNLDKASRRKEGKPGGVVHLIYCCAFVLPEGSHLMTPLNDTDLPWMDTEDNKMVVHAMTPDKIFYNDLDEAAQKRWAAQLKPFSYKCFYSKLTYVGWRDIPSTYFYCLQDQAIPIDDQKGMVEGSGVQFRTETLDASHSPFLSMPDKVVAAVRRAAGEMTV